MTPLIDRLKRASEELTRSAKRVELALGALDNATIDSEGDDELVRNIFLSVEEAAYDATAAARAVESLMMETRLVAALVYPTAGPGVPLSLGLRRRRPR